MPSRRQPAIPPPQSRSRITIDLDPTLRRKLRIVASHKAQTLRVYVENAITEAIAKDMAAAIHAVDDPVLADLWDNDADAIYDNH